MAQKKVFQRIREWVGNKYSSLPRPLKRWLHLILGILVVALVSRNPKSA